MKLDWEEARYVVSGRGCHDGAMTSLHDHFSETETPDEARELLLVVMNGCQKMIEALDEWEADDRA